MYTNIKLIPQTVLKKTVYSKPAMHLQNTHINGSIYTQEGGGERRGGEQQCLVVCSVNSATRRQLPHSSITCHKCLSIPTHYFMCPCICEG